jgi:hypothetical protein
VEEEIQGLLVRWCSTEEWMNNATLFSKSATRALKPADAMDAYKIDHQTSTSKRNRLRDEVAVSTALFKDNRSQDKHSVR